MARRVSLNSEGSSSAANRLGIHPMTTPITPIGGLTNSGSSVRRSSLIVASATFSDFNTSTWLSTVAEIDHTLAENCLLLKELPFSHIDDELCHSGKARRRGEQVDAPRHHGQQHREHDDRILSANKADERRQQLRRGLHVDGRELMAGRDERLSGLEHAFSHSRRRRCLLLRSQTIGRAAEAELGNVVGPPLAPRLTPPLPAPAAAICWSPATKE